MVKAKYDVAKHVLVPKHVKLSEKEKKELLSTLGPKDFPRISVDDPVVTHLEAREGDFIKITRPSKTAGEAVFYRRVATL